MSLKMTLSFTVVITLWLELRHEHKKDKQVGVLYGSLVMAYLPKIVMSCMQFYKQIRRYVPQKSWFCPLIHFRHSKKKAIVVC